MKIHPYLTIIQGQKEQCFRRPQVTKHPPNPRLETTSSAVAESRPGFEVVSIENRRASAQTPPGDLKAAEEVLEQVTEQLGRMTRSDLRGIHRLEGLVHVYQT